MLISDTLRRRLILDEHARERWILSMKLAGIILIVLCAFGLVARVDMEADLVEAAPSTLVPEYHRLAVDISGCTPPRWFSVTPIVEVLIESTSDLGWTAIGCTRFAPARSKPLPSRLVLTQNP